MRSENFVAFFTVCGFFIGLIFSFVKLDDLLDILFYTVAITLFFHLFIHLVWVLIIKTNDAFAIKFDKDEYESVINEQIIQLKERENKITTLLKSLNDHKEFEKERVSS